ncbi:MAG: hypothetical protein ACSLEN_12535 [Candidatus Malihini olakiniferum]
MSLEAQLAQKKHSAAGQQEETLIDQPVAPLEQQIVIFGERCA